MSELPEISKSSRYKDFFLRIDPRSLGLFRILLALVLISLWIIRWRWLNVMYTDAGVLPRSAMEELGTAYFRFTPLAWFGSEWAVRLFFLGALLSYVVLLVGYRTRVASVLAWLFFVSISHRNPYVLIGADFVLASMLTWATLLPLGKRFSLDAVRKAMQGSVPLKDRAKSPDAWDNKIVEAPTTIRPTLVALFVVVHFGLIYFFTGIWKTGETWWEKGTALYYVLHMEQSLYPLGAMLAEAPLKLLKALAYGTLIMEYVAPLAFLLPWGQPWLRRLMLVALAGFHVGIAVTVDAGVFSYAMLACFPLLLLPRDWEAMARFGRRFSRRVTAYYDDNCGICTACCKLLTVLDRYGNLSFIGNSFTEDFRHDVSPELAQQTIVVFDEETGQRGIRSHGVAKLLAALPFPWPLLSFIGWPGIRVVSDVGYRLVATNRTRISKLLGMTACAVPKPGAALTKQQPAEHDSAHSEPTSSGQFGWRLGNALGLVYMICVLTGMYYTNLVPILRIQPNPQSPLTQVGRFVNEGTYVIMCEQYWNMFAPDAPTLDAWWVAEAKLEDGRKVDLFNEGKPADLLRQPRRWETPFSSVWGNYLRHTAALGLLMPQHMIPAYADDHAKILRRSICEYIMREYAKSGGPEIVELNLYLVAKATIAPEEPQNDVYLHLSTMTFENTRPEGEKLYVPNEFAYSVIYGPNGNRIAEGSRDPRNGLALVDYWTFWDEATGRKLNSGEMLNGQRVGIWTEFLPSDEGGGWSEGQIADEKKEGVWHTEYANGATADTTFRNGVLHGPWRTYYPDGSLQAEGQFVDGMRTGKWRDRSADGSTELHREFLDDKEHGEWVRIENGIRVKVENYRDGVLQGAAENYYDNGQMESFGQYTNGERTGRWEFFYPDGENKEAGEYLAGKKHGEWTVWITGGFKTTRTYDHGRVID